MTGCPLSYELAQQLGIIRAFNSRVDGVHEHSTLLDAVNKYQGIILDYLREYQRERACVKRMWGIMSVGVMPMELTKPLEAQDVFHHVFTTPSLQNLFQLAMGRPRARTSTRTSRSASD
jgi:hypothetical protein